MALRLEAKDLGEPETPGRAGVYVWWEKVEDRKSPALLIAWPDLVLIRPVVTWPPEIIPKQIQGWGEDSFRFVHLHELGRVVSREGIPVPDVSNFFDLRRGSLKRLRATRSVKKLSRTMRLALLESEDGFGVYLNKVSLQRISSMLNCKPHELDLRLAPSLENEEVLVVLAYKRGLRAIVSAIPEGEST